VDIKTKAVHFFVLTNTEISLNNTVIPFDIERLNEGGAMNLATGIFTVPVNGIYQFKFTGVKLTDSIVLGVFLQVNGVSISEAYATNLPNYLGLSGINASLRLKSGDQVAIKPLLPPGGEVEPHKNFMESIWWKWKTAKILLLGTVQ